MNDQRRSPRVRCFLTVRTPRGAAVIDELSATGGKLTTEFDVEVGEILLLHIDGEPGASPRSIHAVVARVWEAAIGWRLACEFDHDERTSVRVTRLFERVAGRKSIPA